jgi:hypothetical protein
MKPLPDAALQQHIAVLGKNGSGKTYAAKAVIVEPLLAAGKRVAIVDPTSAWWGLRSSADGKAPGFPVLVLGGDHGDLPLPVSGGAAVARLIVDQSVSLIADTGNLTVGERTRWMIDFAGAIYRLNRTPLYLVIDEAHVFAPQGKVPDPDTGKMLHAVNQLASGGRSRGIRLTMITQRPQKLHKDALTTADTLIAMRVLAPHDRDAVKAWIDGCGDPAHGRDVLNSLAQLKRGEGWVWYPEGGHLLRTHFPGIRTFDSSATPTEGHAVKTPKGAAELDLTEINKALAEAVREAEQNDPKRLRARVLEQEREIKRLQAASAGADLVSVAAARQEGREEAAREGYADGLRAVQPIADRLSTLSAAVSETVQAFQQDLRRLATAPKGVIHVSVPVREKRTATDIPFATLPQQRILDSLASLEAVGIEQPKREQLALWCEVSPTSGGYFNNLGALRSAGLIDYPAGGLVRLTDEGRKVAGPPAPMTVEQMQESLCRKVGPSKSAIVRALIDLYPKAISRERLAERIGVSPTSGGYFNNLGALRTLGVIDYPVPGEVVALPVLFLER